MKEHHRLRVMVLILLAALLTGCHRQPVTRVLFVGNSLTYVGNLPAVLDALSKANGHPLQSDMIVKGGATLTDRVNDGSVARALKQKHYDIVVLQERGGDFFCGFGPESCSNARASLEQLAKLVRANSSRPVLLGTYQTTPESSAILVREESLAADAAQLPYVAISDRLQQGLKLRPGAAWLYTDGMHPGSELVLLESAMIYHQLYDTPLRAQALDVQAPIYRPKAKFQPPAPVSLPLSNADTPTSHDYSLQDVETAIALSRGK